MKLGMCERSDHLVQPTYQLRDLLVLLDDVSHRLSHARPSVHIDEVVASVLQHRQMVARWLAHPPSRTVQANAASTILSVIASANAAAHAAHFDTGSWRPVQAELRAAQHSHPEAATPLYFDLSADQGRGIAKAVLGGEMVPTPLDWLPKAGTKRVCEVHVDGIDEPFVLIAECVGVETPDGVLLQLTPASQRQRTRLQTLAIGGPVDTSKGSRDELPTLTEDQVCAAQRRRQASSRALAAYAPTLTPGDFGAATSEELLFDDPVISEPMHTVEDPCTVHTVEDPSTVHTVEDPSTVQAFVESSTVRPPPATEPPESPIETLLEQYCSDMDEPTSQRQLDASYDDSLPKTEPPPPMHPSQLGPWNTPITMPPQALVATGAGAPIPVTPARVSEPVFAPTADLPKTVPPPAHTPVKTLVSPQDLPPLVRRTVAHTPVPQSPPRAQIKTQELPEMLFANAPVGPMTHHSDHAHIAPIRQTASDRVTPVPTVVEIDAPRPAPKRRRRGGALLLAAGIAIGLFASPTPTLTPAAPTAKTFAPAVTVAAQDAADSVEHDVELVTVKRVLVRKMRSE